MPQSHSVRISDEAYEALLVRKHKARNETPKATLSSEIDKALGVKSNKTKK
jgi:hypothetical protein